MKNKPITEYTNEELINQEKNSKAITILLMVAIPLLFFSNLFITFKHKFSALAVIPIALVPILIVNINKWKQLKKEKADRNL
ncbi:redox-active disulfide protein 2 [Chryseobacterium sp. CKR4-1]|uniref:redox-active disulfide protein 2 n=1 Tax=Chryseobacterium sp. CKR4-1 TaxID=3068896 RepID=UPI002796BF99|nr:redox-active disulfide protein 2 [Chryseobacterium sp. CKR4-1]MDQ1803215.1 redox-active disulfide protein 2 [Chryseobacterium sp. CKR4-1]